MSEKEKKVVQLDDSAYQAQLDSIKQRQAPLGHVAAPPMPRLDQPPGDRWQGVQGMAPVMRPDQVAALAQQGQFIPGVGSMYAANQPALQRPPVQPPPPGQPLGQTMTGGRQVPNPGLSPEEINRTYGQPGNVQRPAASSEQSIPGPQIPGTPAQFLSPQTSELLVRATAAAQEKAADSGMTEEEKLKKEFDVIAEDDEYILDGLGNRIRNLLNNRDRRKAIELRCPELSLDDLLIHQELRQTVPIVPKKFVPTFRMPSGEEDLFVKSLIRTEDGTSRYILDKFAMMNLCLGIYALNGVAFPNHLDNTGVPDDKLFWPKYKVLVRYPITVLADLSVNYVWFDERVRRLVVVDNLKDF